MNKPYNRLIEGLMIYLFDKQLFINAYQKKIQIAISTQ